MTYRSTLNEICSLLDTYKGRDKVLRTLCYSTRLMGGLSKNVEIAKKLLYVSKHLSETRTTLRLLDDLPMLKFSLEYGLGKEENNPFMSSVGVLTNIIDQLYYPVEKVAWLAEHKLISGVDNSKWDTASSIFWIASIYLTLIKSSRHFIHLRKHVNDIRGSNNSDSMDLLEQLYAKERFELITCIRLSLDLMHAINTLPEGFLWSSKLNTWQVGLIGTLSSVIGLYQYFARKNV